MIYEYILTNKESKFYNEDNFKEDYKFKVVFDCDVIIDYGNKKEKIKLIKDDEIYWDDNVIILHNKMNHYRSNVSKNELIIKAQSLSLLKIIYEKPKEEKIAPGSGWEAMM
jgi:hypothetical protein